MQRARDTLTDDPPAKKPKCSEGKVSLVPAALHLYFVCPIKSVNFNRLGSPSPVLWRCTKIQCVDWRITLSVYYFEKTVHQPLARMLHFLHPLYSSCVSCFVCALCVCKQLFCGPFFRAPSSQLKTAMRLTNTPLSSASRNKREPCELHWNLMKWEWDRLCPLLCSWTVWCIQDSCSGYLLPKLQSPHHTTPIRLCPLCVLMYPGNL